MENVLAICDQTIKKMNLFILQTVIKIQYQSEQETFEE